MMRCSSRLRPSLLTVLFDCSTAGGAAAQTCSTPAPNSLKASIASGMVVSLDWRFGAASSPSYVVEIGTAAGASDVTSIETGNPATSRLVQLPAGSYFIRVRARNGCLSPPSNEVTITVTASSIDDAYALTFRCPTAAEMTAIDAEVRLTFDGDPSAGATVCTVGARQLTLLQANAYRSLIAMRRLTFDAPLPWTSESLYTWMIHSIGGIRFRSDIQFSFCCDPADTINIQTGVAIAQPTSPPDPDTILGFSDLLAHETRHRNIGGHTCGTNDQTLAELGAWAAQYYTASWIADHSDPAFVPTAVREAERRVADIVLPRFCSTAGPTMTLDRKSLTFGATASSTAFVSQTGAQTVRLTPASGTAVSWTAVSNVPWLAVSPAFGRGSAALNVSLLFAPGLVAAQTGTLTLTMIGTTSTPGPVNVTLKVGSSGAVASPPFGSFDTPAGDATPLAGSIALTGWALDNVGVKQVELWRDLQTGETTPPGNSTPGDPRSGKIFIANATFVDNARPDVEALNPTIPANYRAGWGYLMLTWGLFGQGNGTYKFYAFAVDQEGNTATIGTKTVVISNNTATKPFGSIDTPAIGGDASGPNFGWGLTPKVNGAATCKIQPSGVQYSIDSLPLQPVVYGDARTDIAGAFPGFSNTGAAGGHAIIDWSTLSNGTHTIGWLITDDCNRADGAGSRFFNVTSGTALTAAETASAIAPPASRFRRGRAEPEIESEDPITVARGYGELPEIVKPGVTGSRTVEMTQGQRIEIRLPRGFESAHQLGPGGQRRALPAGSTWDAASQTFYWQPAPGFLGRYRIVFSNGAERITVRVIVLSE